MLHFSDHIVTHHRQLTNLLIYLDVNTYSKVDAGDSIHDDEDVGVCQLFEAEI